MGGTQSQTMKAAEINAVISSTITSQLMSNSTAVSTVDVTKQIIVNSDNCVNYKDSTTSVAIKVDTSVFQNAETYQDTVTDITNSLTGDQGQKLSGFSMDDQVESIQAAITNIVENNVTQDSMDINSNSISNTQTSLQVCANSDNSLNFYDTTTQDIGVFYTEAYQSNVAIQKASTDIANSMDLAQTQKKTGLLQMILMIIVALVILAIVIVVGVVAFEFII